MTAVSNVVRLDRPAAQVPSAPLVSPAPVVPPAARSDLDSFRYPGEAARAVISGNAGSGKTTLLRHIAGLLAAEDTTTTHFRASTEVAKVPAPTVLLVDDAQLLSEECVAALSMRAEDPDAGLVVALRTWPSRPDVASLIRLLERSRPAILLGGVSTGQMAASETVFGTCNDDIMALTGGVAWLVHECRDAHDERDCRDEPGHPSLQHAIRPRILHRLMSASPHVRRLIDDLSLGLSLTTDAAASADDANSLLSEGYAEGLLTSDGRPAPAIAAAVRAMTPVARLAEVILTASPVTLREEGLIAGFDGVRDARAAEALATRARIETSRDPDLANELLDLAISYGADAETLSFDRARTAWVQGRLDDAGILLDAQLAREAADPAPQMVDLAAAVWAERGMMSLADDTYRAHRPADAAMAIRMRVAAAAAGRPPRALDDPRADSSADGRRIPSAIGIAGDFLDRGLSATLENRPDEAMAALQRASELYTASGDESASVELPAVIAAGAAIGVGDLKSAQTIVEDALHGGQGGAHRRARLELWSSWIALQRERPADARAALVRATSGRPLSARNDALAATISIGIARRYDDAAGLAAEWDSSQARVGRSEPDLFSLLSLSELVIAAARLGDGTSLQPAFERALRLVSDLGGPPIWSTALHWAGIQRGILLNQPDALAPHARSLVAAAPHNRLAARMAHAGKVWTAVLSGTVDPDAVEEAARGLAAVGLAWDGARLAGHGAGRSDDRRIIARLLACARELHPRESTRATDEEQDSVMGHPGDDGVMSGREREVAELVLQGKTYAEIGAAIFISPRTAEHHIAHIRRRLNATSRSDLLSKLRVALDGSAPFVDAGEGGPRS